MPFLSFPLLQEGCVKSKKLLMGPSLLPIPRGIRVLTESHREESGRKPPGEMGAFFTRTSAFFTRTSAEFGKNSDLTAHLACVRWHHEGCTTTPSVFSVGFWIRRSTQVGNRSFEVCADENCTKGRNTNSQICRGSTTRATLQIAAITDQLRDPSSTSSGLA